MIDGGLRKLFREHVAGDWCSIESGSTSGGIPDSNFCINGIEGWLELKQTKGHAVTLLPAQVGWLCRRARAGGRVWIAVRQQAPAGPRREARDSLWLIPGRLAKEAKVDGLRGSWASQALVWHNGPSQWPWAAVAARLVS